MDGLSLKLFSATRPDVVIHFWVHTQKIKKYKNIYKKIFGRNSINNMSEKRMLECRKKAKIG
jgi:hypothetical protein